ncbi:helix-turn-helix domain-containing protein [Staphylococcus pseudintermedius]|uniref:helix-turn-helix domain-containing protein n=1 Tax=Staphylococcus pseudintermedius TaxID=283734 RepID=UPI001C1FBF51|nr:helix-turn-helix transcriptional regulator [Staphylococcus pseudintermedius]
MKNNLSMIMGKKRITAMKLSKETGVSRSTIHSLYHEKTKNPDTQTIIKLCEHLDVTPNEFLGIGKKVDN